MILEKLSAKDFASDQDIKWCPGCGDYSILKQVQTILPDSDIPKEKVVFISGIGCSSRFPYYMNTYGMHSIHGRAPAIATGLKLADLSLDIWIITGDGDALSIGGNHIIHLLRRNMDVNVLLFNNEIYGLTKGQYSPTSSLGLKTRTSPLGVIDQPFNPLQLALGAGGTFIARTIDRDPEHLRTILKKGRAHKGTSFIEMYQNCIIFNDKVFEDFSDKSTKFDTVIKLENKQPLVFGKEDDKGIILDGLQPKVVSLNEYSINDLWIHDETDATKANILTRIFDNPLESKMPRPFGVLYNEKRPSYNDVFIEQHNAIMDLEADLKGIISGKNIWEVTNE